MAAHKHAELIKAWADGAEIEYTRNGMWYQCDTFDPSWHHAIEYRVKPAPDQYAALKQAWADGKPIQLLSPLGYWTDLYGVPGWDHPVERFRIKPEPIVHTRRIVFEDGVMRSYQHGGDRHNVKLEFDPDTHKLISASLIN